MIDIFDVAVAILAPFLLPRVVSVLFFFSLLFPAF